MNWFYYILIATFFYGMMNFMFKVAAVHKCQSHEIVNKSAMTISILSFLTILYSGSSFDNLKMILFFGIINSTFFGMGSIMKITALKNAPSSIVFPVTKMNALFVIIISLFLFNETPNMRQWIGIIISISMIIYIGFTSKKNDSTKKEKDESRELKGVFFALIAASCTTISMLTGKFASTSVPKLNYIFVSYSFVMIYTFFINRYFHNSKTVENRKKVFLFGFIIGFFNFIGYFMVLKAFSMGPMSLIQAIFSNSFLIPVALSIFFLKEKFDIHKAIVIILAIISIILIKV